MPPPTVIARGNEDFPGGGVGPWSTFINATPAAPNSAYPDTGAGSPGAEISANSARIQQFRDDLQAAVTAGFAEQGAKYGFSVPLENPHRFNQTGQAPNPFTGEETKPAYSPADQQQYSPVRSDTTATEDEQAFFDRGIPGFTVSGVKNSGSDENPYAAPVSAATKATPIIGYAGNQTTFQIGDNTPVGGMSTTAAPAAAGDTNVKVTDVTNLAAGEPIFIDTGSGTEYDTIQSVGTSGAGGTGVTLAAPLRSGHASGVPFNVNEGQPVGYTGDTIEHLNYFASGAPHGPAGPSQPSVELQRANVKATIQPAGGTTALTGTRGHLARFVIRLRNASGVPVRFARCPLLAEELAPAGQTEVHQLNCHAVRPIPPGGSLYFEMGIHVPASAPLGKNGLFWQLDPTGAQFPETVTGLAVSR